MILSEYLCVNEGILPILDTFINETRSIQKKVNYTGEIIYFTGFTKRKEKYLLEFASDPYSLSMISEKTGIYRYNGNTIIIDFNQRYDTCKYLFFKYFEKTERKDTLFSIDQKGNSLWGYSKDYYFKNDSILFLDVKFLDESFFKHY